MLTEDFACILVDVVKPFNPDILRRLRRCREAQRRKGAPGRRGSAALPPEFRLLFEQSPAMSLVVLPDADFTIVAASDAYLRATLTTREGTYGRPLFEVFPDNPAEPHATGVVNLRASLLRALAAKAPDIMAVQRYDIRRPEAEGGGFEERHWRPVNTPVLGPEGEVRYLLHQVEDVTQRVRLAGVREAQRPGESEARLATTLSSIGDAVLTTDAQGRVTFLNPGAQALMGWRRERERLHNLFENAPAFVCTLRGPEHVFEMVNPSYQRLVGTGRELTGLRLQEALPEVVEQGFLGLLDGVYRTGEPFIGREVPVRLKRGGGGEPEDAFVTFVYQPTRDARGQVEGIDVFGFEVTDSVLARRRVEALAEELKAGEERLRRVVEASGAGTCEVDPATGHVTADEQLRELFFVPKEAPFDLSVALSRIHPADREQANAAIARAVAGENEGRYLVEYRTVSPGGRCTRWVEARARMTYGAQAGAPLLVGTVVDITARKEAEAGREALLEALGAQPLLGVALYRGPRFVIEMANSLFRQVVGSGRDILGKPLFEALPELKEQVFESLLGDVWRTGQPFVGWEVPATFDRLGDGRREEFFFDFVYQPVHGANGTDAVLVLFQEVTQRVWAQRQVKERSDFEQQLIGIVSHDLRNPISAIALSAAVLLRRLDLDERQYRSLGRIVSSAERANRMIRDLLDFTQARLGGGLPIHPEAMDLHAIARQVVDEIQVSHPERLLKLEQLGEGEGVWDADRMAQVLGNLLSNALHYSPAGTPVEVRTRGETGGVVLEVHNVGAPIPEDVLPRLFQPMQRGAGAAEKSSRSVGLGLYIVRSIVDGHGGTIDVKSTAEAGTTFTVRLPREPPKSAG